MATRTLVDIFEKSIREYAGRKLFGIKEEGAYKWLTYERFGEEVTHFRGALAHLGVTTGDTVAIIADNRIEWAVADYATLGLGARFCPMYEAQRFEDWAYIIEDSEAKVLIVASQAIFDKVSPLIDELDTLERVIYIDGERSENSYHRMLGVGMENPAELTLPVPSDVCALIYTSGTTGKPKGVLLSHENVVSNIESMNSFELVRTDDVSLTFLPWAHAFGHTVELHLMFANGAAMGLVESIATITDNLLEIRPTILFAVPRIFNQIYEGVHKKIEEESPLKQRIFNAAVHTAEKVREDLDEGRRPGVWTRTKSNVLDSVVFSKIRDRFGGRLRYAISGGAALSPVVAEFIDTLHITVLEGYGLTETAPLVTANVPGARKIGSAGRAIPGVEVFIEQSEDHPEGVGEVCVRGPNVMLGYHHLPEKTTEVLDEDGAFHTGDLGRIDEDGFLWLLGRIKEEFKLQNGKYVAPAALEEQLQLSPFIDQAMIEGANRPYPVAIINLSSERLHQWAEDGGIEPEDAVDDERTYEMIEKEITRLTEDVRAYEKPRKFLLVDEEWDVENGLLTPTLKLRRNKLTDLYHDEIEALYD
ncbi:MAG: AMP-dependent synthetase/ligase [Bradymonadaceae bacterium]